MKRSDLRSAMLAAAGLGILLALPHSAVSGEPTPKSLEALAAESASTPAQHQALAAYYRRKSAAAREDVETHREMALSYSNHQAGGMTAHCDNLAKAAQQQAAEYEALAAFHEAEATKAGK